MAKRYYTTKKLTVGKAVTLDGEEFHHLKNVMRTRVGEEVILFNGDGNDAYGKVARLDKNSATITIDKVTPCEHEPSCFVTLFQAVCKGDKLSLIAQKITELGARQMVVFYSDFTDIKDKTGKLDKLERVSISAAKQCKRASLVKISGVVSFDEMIKKAKELDEVYVAYEHHQGTSLIEAIKNSAGKGVGIIIGAEGGFSQNELDKLLQEKIVPVSLGNRILRTETAAIASVATIIFTLEKK